MIYFRKYRMWPTNEGLMGAGEFDFRGILVGETDTHYYLRDVEYRRFLWLWVKDDSAENSGTVLKSDILGDVRIIGQLPIPSNVVEGDASDLPVASAERG